MLQFSVRALLLRLRDIYSAAKPLLDATTKVSAGLAAAKELIKTIRSDDSRFSLHFKHRSSDAMSLSYLFSLLWVDLYRRHHLIDTVDKLMVDAVMRDSLDRALTSLKNSLSYHGSEASVNETYEIFIKAGVQAYLDAKAPTWDNTLLSFFDREHRHPITEAYIEMYHDSVVGNAMWITKMKTLYPEASVDLFPAQFNFLRNLSSDDYSNQLVLKIVGDSRTNWYSYLPTAMFIASQELTKSYNIVPAMRVMGQISMNGVPSIVMAPAGYASARRKVHQAGFMPPPYLSKKHFQSLERERIRLEKALFEAEERAKTPNQK